MSDHWQVIEDALTAHRKYVNATHPTFDTVRHEKVLGIDAALAFVREQRQLAERSEWTMLDEDEQRRVQICESHYIEEAGDDAARFFDAWVTATAIVFDDRSAIELPEDEYRIFRRVQREDDSNE